MQKRIVYLQTSGVDSPERAYAPFVLASTARAMDIDATVYFFIEGVTLMKRGEAEKIQVGAFPPLKDVMRQALDAGVRLMVCEQSTQLLGLERGDFIDEAKVVGAATLNDLVLDADAVICV